MRILVTGGAGFIGSNFVYYLLKYHPEDSILCVDKLTYAGNMANLERALQSPRLRFYRADICDRDAIGSIFASAHPDIVVNFAAESHVDRSIEGPEVFLQTNILGTQVLLEAAREDGHCRFHQVSTDEVYGELPLDKPETRFTEESPVRPSSPYSASKAGADHLVMAYCRTYDLPATISRSSNNYGPFQFPEKLIPRMITNALLDQTLPVYGKGENVRDWLHVEDHCAAIDRIMREGRPGRIYNVGGKNEVRNIDLVRRICEILGKPQSLIAFVEDRKGHDLRYAVDPSRLREELGWKPEAPFSQGLRDTVQWYLDNRSWWETLKGTTD